MDSFKKEEQKDNQIQTKARGLFKSESNHYLKEQSV